MTFFRQFTALVVDDEPLPRAHLAHLLQSAGVGSVLQAADAATCLEMIESDDVAVDWAFLDVQMPGMNGLILADALGAGNVASHGAREAPAIVFVTGYEEYAVKAFDRAAVDYLLKPVQRERLAVTLSRLAGLAAGAAGVAIAGREKPSYLPVPALERLPIRLDYAVRLLDVADILAANARNKRVDVITRDSAYPTYYSLSQLEERLPASRFLRVHDSWIVSVADVLELHNLGGEAYQIRLRSSDQVVPVSRRRLPALRAALGI